MELWHEAAGSGERPVLLIHAGICDARMWDRQMSSLAGSRRVLRCDLRGFGRTPLPEGSFSHAADVIELLESVAAGPADLIGTSLGGRVALEVAAARADLVDRLVLAGAVVPGHEWSPEMERYDAEETELLERGEIDAAVELNLRTWVDGSRRGPGAVAPPVRAAVAAMQRRAFEIQVPVWAGAEEELLMPDLGDRLSAIQAPALLVTGAEDVSDIHAIAARLERELPAASTAVIEDAAHLPSLERPDEFDALAAAFLAR